MATGPANGIMGDENFGTDLPQTEVPENEITAEKSMARFSKSREFKELEKHMESRIAFYQEYLPDGTPVATSGLSNEELGAYWRDANIVIGEFNGVINSYKTAGKLMKK